MLFIFYVHHAGDVDTTSFFEALYFSSYCISQRVKNKYLQKLRVVFQYLKNICQVKSDLESTKYQLQQTSKAVSKLHCVYNYRQ